MESDVVVLVDVDDLRSSEARQSLYVGLSRSRALLAVFMAEVVRDDYEALASTSANGSPRPSGRSRSSRSPSTVNRTILAVSVRHTIMDLFAGCGGMTRGFVDSGRFERCSRSSDHDAADTYRRNFGDLVAQTPIEDVGPSLGPTSSSAARPARASRRSTATASASNGEHSGASTYARLKSAATAFVMENVPQLLRSAEYDAFASAARKARIRVEDEIFNAADYGVPQRRRRAIVIGIRSGRIPWPDPTHRTRPSAVPGWRPWRTFRDAVRGSPARPDGGLAPGPKSATARASALQGRPARRRRPLRDAGNLTAAGLGDLVRGAGATSRPARPTSSVDSGGIDPRTRSAPSSTSPRRVAISIRGAPADHDPRGSPLHELPGRLRTPRAPEDDVESRSRSGMRYRRCSPNAWQRRSLLP